MALVCPLPHSTSDNTRPALLTMEAALEEVEGCRPGERWARTPEELVPKCAAASPRSKRRHSVVGSAQSPAEWPSWHACRLEGTAQASERGAGRWSLSARAGTGMPARAR